MGLIPSIEYQRIPKLQIIPGISVASTSRVRSVLLVQRREVEEVRSVALDTSSRTSVVLAKLLLELRMGLKPRYIPHPPDLDVMLRNCDAAIVIGDRALQIALEDFRITDLAEAWIEWQHRPFVFALWACRSDTSHAGEFAGIFKQAKEYGLASRPQIAASYAESLSLPEPFLLKYLSENVDYDLGPSHIEGLSRFYALAREKDLIAELRPVRFLNLDTSNTPAVTTTR